MTIGNMLKQWLTRLEWFETLFPRIPVPIQQDIEYRLRAKYGANAITDEFTDNGASNSNIRRTPPPDVIEAVKRSNNRSRSRSRSISSRISDDEENGDQKKKHHKLLQLDFKKEH